MLLWVFFFQKQTLILMKIIITMIIEKLIQNNIYKPAVIKKINLQTQEK